MSNAKRSLERVERLVEVRQSYVTAAEARIREAELVVRQCEEAEMENTRQIQQARQEIAYLQEFSAHDFQTRERYISRLQMRARALRQDVEKSRQTLAFRRLEWQQAMRDRKIVEKVQERRLHEWQREAAVRQQKAVDDMTIGRYARNQSEAATNTNTESRPVSETDIERRSGN